MKIQISFENLKDYEAGNNSRRTNKINNEWLRGRIIKRIFEKSLWINSIKILSYLPTFNKNQRNLRQILVDADYTTIKCYRCGSFGKIGKRKNSYFICEKCGLVTNKHYNASNNIAKRTIEYFKEHILSPILSCWGKASQKPSFLFIETSILPKEGNLREKLLELIFNKISNEGD